MENRTSSRKTRVGLVVSDKMDKTVVVAIADRVAHPLYKKILKRPAPCPRISAGAWLRSSRRRNKEVPA